MSMRRLAAKAAYGVFAAAAFAGAAMAQVSDGMPTNGAIGLQPGVSPLRSEAIRFHDYFLLPIITAITLLVLVLLLYCIVKFNKRANPVPAKWSHNTPVEIVWTVLPVLILMAVAIWSFQLLFRYHDMPKPDLTVKATGYQWYWGYEYPDHGVSEIISNILPEDEAKARNVPYKLAATEPMVVPVNSTVRVLVTGADVIHAFAVPSFGVITDAIPGRVNEIWFRAEKTGVFYGQCRELCGVDHAFMPIEVHVVSQPEFDAWVASKGGAPPAPTPTTLAAPGEAVPGQATTNEAPASPPAAAEPAPAPAAGTDPAAAPAPPAAKQ